MCNNLEILIDSFFVSGWEYCFLVQIGCLGVCGVPNNLFINFYNIENNQRL